MREETGLHRLWIGTQTEPNERTQIVVSPEDSDAIDRLPSGPSKERATVTDTLTGKTHTIRRANCGLHCYCALDFDEPTEAPNRQEWKPLELLIAHIDAHGYTWAYNGHSYQQITSESAIAWAFSRLGQQTPKPRSTPAT